MFIINGLKGGKVERWKVWVCGLIGVRGLAYFLIFQRYNKNKKYQTR
jgi:hypothetical protein